VTNGPKEGAVLASVLTGRRVLLIIQPSFALRSSGGIPMWKFPGGEIEPGEDVEVAPVREIADETGFNIPIRRNPVDNKWVVGDESVRLLHRSQRQCPSRGGGTHPQHFFVFSAPERDVLHLGNTEQIHKEDDEGETIRRGIFDLDKVSTMPDFLHWQRPLLEQVLALKLV